MDEILDRIGMVAGTPLDSKTKQAVLNQLSQNGPKNQRGCLRTACMTQAEWQRENWKMRPDLAEKFITAARACVDIRLRKMGLSQDWRAIDRIERVREERLLA